MTKIDFTSAFIQTGDAKRDIYVVPPRECHDKSFYWLLLTSAYGLVNANSKWQEHCDYLFTSLGLTQSRYVPQLFYTKKNEMLELVAVRIVDDVLLIGDRYTIENFIAQVQRKYKLGIVMFGPGTFLFFGLKLTQETDMTITIHAEKKLESLNCFPIDRHRRKQLDEHLNQIELKSFRSVNSSIGWLGTNDLLFCAFYSS